MTFYRRQEKARATQSAIFPKLIAFASQTIRSFPDAVAATFASAAIVLWGWLS